jgi:hypothetical protein
MRAWTAGWIAGSLLACAASAIAEPRVVLVETRDSPPLPALASQVELHATRRATVQTLAERGADPLTYAERAAQLVASGAGAIVVWIARVDRGFLVFAAGPWPGRALIELVRIDAKIEPAEIERTIALKIAGLLDTLLVPGVSAAEALGVVPGEGQPDESRPGPVRSRAARRPARWQIEVAALLAREPHERASDGRTAVAVSRAWVAGAWAFAPTLAVHWQPSGTIDGTGGSAELTEVGAALAVEGSRELGPIQAFVRPRLVLAALLARGESSDGRSGEETVLAPYTGIELGVRRRIGEAAWVGITGGVDLAMIHHEFLIDREVILDLGRARMHVGLSLTVAF